MKLLIFFCLFCFVSCDLLEDAAPALDESLIAFFQGAAKAGSLSKALGTYDPEIEQLGDDLERELGRTVLDALKDLLRKIQDHVDNGKQISRDLLSKVKELREQLKDLSGKKAEEAREIFRKIREKAKEALKKILDRMGFGKRNLDDSMDYVARMKFLEILEQIKQKLLSQETIDKMKEYVKNLSGDSPLVRKLKNFIGSLKDHEIRELLTHLLEQKPKSMQHGETWDKIKKFFKDLNVKIQDQSRKFGEWVKNVWGKGLEKLKAKYGVIRAIAMEFIANSKDMSAEMSREALEFFRPYKDELGSLWDQLIDATKEAVGKF